MTEVDLKIGTPIRILPAFWNLKKYKNYQEELEFMKGRLLHVDSFRKYPDSDKIKEVRVDLKDYGYRRVCLVWIPIKYVEIVTIIKLEGGIKEPIGIPLEPERPESMQIDTELKKGDKVIFTGSFLVKLKKSKGNYSGKVENKPMEVLSLAGDSVMIDYFGRFIIPRDSVERVPEEKDWFPSFEDLNKSSEELCTKDNKDEKKGFFKAYIWINHLREENKLKEIKK